MTRPVVLLPDVLVDGTGAEPREHVAVSIEDGRITAVDARTRTWRPQGGHEVVELPGTTVTPGLIDSHVHLALPGDTEVDVIAFAQEASDEELLEVMRRHAAESLRTGVTTVRDCGSPRNSGVRLRAELAAGKVPGPRVLVSGRPITTATGHCHWMGRIAASADDVRTAVRELVAEDVDFIKVMATGGMLTAGSNPYDTQYTREELSALVEEAHAHGRRVAAHVLCAAGLAAAVGARVDTVEHGWTITGKRQDQDPAVSQALIEAGIVASVTAHWALRGLLEAGDLDTLRARLDGHRLLRLAGATVLVHSDAGTPGTTFTDFAQSVEAFQRGLQTSVAEAVQAATSIPAAALGLDDVGTVAPGQRADLLVLGGDLREDPKALRRVRQVLQDGVPV